MSLSGQLSTTGSIQSLTIGGSVLGGDVTGNTMVTNNGTILVSGNVGTFKIGKDFVSGRDFAGNLSGSSIISVGGTIGTMTVGGSITGNNLQKAQISVGGAFVGGPVAAIKSLSVKGSVLFASILAGYEFTSTAQNSDAGFGSITIGGNLMGSFISFGTSPGGDGIPGTSDDGAANSTNVPPGEPARPATATVGSIKIGGSFSGIAGDATNYYIYGSILKKLTVGKASYVQTQIAGLEFHSIGRATATSIIR